MNPLFQDLFIFEMANNHQGSLEHGLRIIEAMGKISRKHGIRAGVKFQYRDLETLVHPDFYGRTDVKHVPRFKETRLAMSDYQILVNAVHQEGMVTICTPFDEPSVGHILDHGIEIIKVASASANDWPLLERIAAARKPVICSTGGKSIYDIDNIVSFFEHRKVAFAILHCVGIYPTPASELYLDFIDRLQKRYRNIPIGYSGHEDPNNTDVVKIAVAKGATILERHVGIAQEGVPLNKYSMSPEQTDAWVAAALMAQEMCGRLSKAAKFDKKVTQTEIDSLETLARGVYAARPIKQGETLTADSVFFAMPVAVSGQTTTATYQASMVASRDYAPNEAIMEHRPASPINMARTIIHDAKGMLYESGIEIGDDFELELSHHYGLEHFRQTGALIINIVNREYCKKLVILLPGQSHPSHFHKIKEETFQLLWGEMDLVLDEETKHLKPGDKVLVERGHWHSFSSAKGAIFEEISTRHIRGDSYYADPKIASLDPMQRKTILEAW